jgi:hypothetical protein
MRTKKERGLTALQRQALECVRGAKTKRVNLSGYCRARGVAVRQVYDALIPLRRRGLLPKPWRRARATETRSSGPFIAVKIAPPVAPIACRVMLPGGLSIECAQWPPRAWLQSLTGVDSTDAAA